jgi:hypothetical protein
MVVGWHSSFLIAILVFGIWETDAMNFTKTFLEKIGYKLDRSEHYKA